ncbi:DigA protein [Rhizoctonia solani AG-1 IA]|uniref:DigA protein n=1 Tax=Thanatephorus cucumeris (strain AG1-IA) TaxID=983506 RepID=L8WXK0_THACA|nr:DigA protein [Rhizoctonia solani AG-1 IA]
MSEAITPANESVDTERVGSISQVSGHQHVLVACGDSFVGPLKLLNRGRVLVKRFSGASAKVGGVGLGNKNSVSQTGVLVTQLLDTYKPEQVLFVFGQVDLHILYLWKALKAQRDGSDPPTPDDWRLTVLNSYTTFLRNNILTRRLSAGDSGYLRNIFVASVIAPCVNDDYLDESVRKYQRREEDAVQTRDLHLADSRVPTDIHTRRAMVQEFNAALSLFCEDNNVRFVDINKVWDGPSLRVIERAFSDPSTIHVQWESTIRYWVEELTEAGLTENDIHVDLNDSALQYEAEKKGRMQRRKVTAADATLSPTLSDYSVMSEDPGSPLLLPRSATWTRGRSSTPPPISHARTTQASPEHNSSWRGRMELGRGRGNTGSPPRGPKPSRFQFGSSSRNRAEKDDNWRSHARIHSASHVPSTADLTGVFQLTTTLLITGWPEHSGRPGVVTSPKTRALPQLHYEGFEPNTTAAGGLETPIATRVDEQIAINLKGTPDEEPIFRLAPVQYTPPAQITNLVVSNNILIICFNNNNLHRIDMAMQDYIGELSLGKKPQEATVHKMFLDPSGKHLLITTAQGDNYYLYEGWKKSKQLGRLKMVIEAVAWNDEKLFPYSGASSQSGPSTHEILLGGRNGTIYEALISPAEEFFKSPDRYVQAVYTLPDKQSVCGIKFERLKDDPSRAVVVIATASRLYQLVGPVGGKADTDGSRVFETLFASYNRDTPAKYMELSGGLQYSTLQFYSPEHAGGAPGKRLAWLTSRGLFHATLATARQLAGDLPSQDFLDTSSLLPYPTSLADGSSRSPGGNNFPLGVVLTEFHFLLLLSDRVMGYSRLDDSLIYDEAISLVSRSFLDPSTLSSIGQRRAERLLGIVSDPINRTLWIYSTNGLYEVVRVDEERDVWKIYLDKADYALALKFAKVCYTKYRSCYLVDVKQLPRHRDTVLAAQGAAFFNQGQFIQAAQSYSQSASAPFEEVALKFVDVGERDALRYFLRSRLATTRKTVSRDVTQRAMLATWLIEFYLSKCNELDDLIASSSASNDVSNLQAEQIHLEEELQEFFETYKANLDRKTTYDLIRGHGRTDVFLDFAGVTGDFERIIEHWVSEEEWVKAIDVLHRQVRELIYRKVLHIDIASKPDLELYYRFASAMIRSAPKETVDAWTRRPALDPIRLIPALLQQQHRPVNPLQQNHSVRYLNHLVFEQGNTTPTIHNLIVTFLAANNDDGPLLRFLTTAPSDPISSRPYYDLDYALRICRTNGRIQPCVHIYAKMGLYEESVSLALEKGDLELAQITANMPEDDIQLRKKLWLKVARYVVEDKKDIKTAMQFLSNTELLKIEDILPFFPDFVVIDDFKDDICNALEDYSARIVELKQDMDGAMESAAAVSRDISQLKNRFVIIEQGERCTQCQAPLLLRQFYAFPCQHTFHADCLIGLAKESLSAVQLRRIVALQTELVKLASSQQTNGQPVISAPVAPVPPSTPQASRASTQAQRTLLSATFATGGVNGSLTRALNPLTAAATMGSVMVTASDKLRDLIVPDALATAVGVWGDRGKAIGGAIGINHNHANEGETGSRIESLRAELDNVLAGSCPLCDSVVSGIDKPFIKEGEIDTSWTI